MTNKHFILDKDHNLVETDLITWARFFEDLKNGQVALSNVGGKVVSTIFLGIDYNWREGEPHLFETMVFPGDYQVRYSTWKAAEIGHKDIVKRIKNGEVF